MKSALILPNAQRPQFLLVHGHDSPRHDLRLAMLSRFGLRESSREDFMRQDFGENLAIVLDVPLETPEQIDALRRDLLALPKPTPPICCVIDRFDRTLILRAHALGAEAVLHRPLSISHAQRVLEGVLNRTRKENWKASHSTAGAGLSAGTDVLEDLFAFAAGSTRMTQYELYDRGDNVIESLSATGLGGWIEAVKSHHSQTFRHSLLVTGIAVGFGQQLAMRQADLRRLALSGLVHDIGKALIPQSILEKPTKLNRSETEVMREHAALGRDILTRQGGFAPEMVDVVAHHHEMLDGSGYPDGLMGNSVKDLVRVMTISDIFAALIEERAYKSPMDNGSAFEVLQSMEGKLDMALLGAFRPIAMETRLAA